MTRTELLSDTTTMLDELPLDQLHDFHAMLKHQTAQHSVYETAPRHVRDSIAKGIGELDRGEGIPAEDVAAEMDARLKAHGA